MGDNEKVMREQMRKSLLTLARKTECLFDLFFQTFSVVLKERSFINGFFFADFKKNQQLKMQETNGKYCSCFLILMKTVSVSELIALHICCHLYLF